MMKNTQMNLDCINIFKGLAYAQMLVQDQKAALVTSGYFNDYQIFHRMTQKNQEKIFSRDLIEYLGIHRIAASQRQCQFLIWNAGSNQPFLTYEQFCVYMTNNQPQLLDRMQNSVLSNNMNPSDQIMRSTNQREMARILQKEIQFYRTIEQLREDFIKKYGYNFKAVISHIDKEKKGNITFQMLARFVYQHGVEFSIQEFQALCRKIKAKHRDIISFKQILRALTPFEPLSFPTYRKQSNYQQAMDYISSQLAKLNIDTNNLPFDQQQIAPKTSTGFQKVVDNFRNTVQQGNSGGTNKYFYDKNYYNELRQYKTTFFDPNKQIKKKYQAKGNNQLIGPQYHDHFFADYYLYLDQRNKTEHYYNKFGKRYTFENPITKSIQGKY